MRQRLVALLLAALVAPAAALAQADAERLRTAKEAFFDRNYAESREAWQSVAASGRGPDAQAALYWVARCSESLGESERALGFSDSFVEPLLGQQQLGLGEASEDQVRINRQSAHNRARRQTIIDRCPASPAIAAFEDPLIGAGIYCRWSDGVNR